jgi:hypothetical protein
MGGKKARPLQTAAAMATILISAVSPFSPAKNSLKLED